MAFSILQNPTPNVNGCRNVATSPGEREVRGGREPEDRKEGGSSRRPTPTRARTQPTADWVESFLPENIKSNIGTTTTAREHMNALFDAEVVSSPAACAR